MNFNVGGGTRPHFLLSLNPKKLCMPSNSQTTIDPGPIICLQYSSLSLSLLLLKRYNPACIYYLTQIAPKHAPTQFKCSPYQGHQRRDDSKNPSP